jgi:hypothetical protein
VVAEQFSKARIVLRHHGSAVVGGLLEGGPGAGREAVLGDAGRAHAGVVAAHGLDASPDPAASHLVVVAEQFSKARIVLRHHGSAVVSQTVTTVASWKAAQALAERRSSGMPAEPTRASSRPTGDCTRMS